LEQFFKRLRIYEKIPTFFAMRESLMTTLAAQVFATPLIVFYFGRFSVIAPLANICVAPIVPLAMLFSAAALLISIFWWEGALWVAYFASFFLDWILEVAELGARFDWASIS
jgi:competence protein ComEC